MTALREAWASGAASSNSAPATRAHVANDMILTDVDDRDVVAEAKAVGMSVEDYCAMQGIDPAEAVRRSSRGSPASPLSPLSPANPPHHQERSASRERESSKSRPQAADFVKLWSSEQSDTSRPRSASKNEGQPTLTRAKDLPTNSEPTPSNSLASTFSSLIGGLSRTEKDGTKDANKATPSNVRSSSGLDLPSNARSSGLERSSLHEDQPRVINRRVSSTMGASSSDLKSMASSYAKDMGMAKNALRPLDRSHKGPEERHGSPDRDKKDKWGKDSYHPMEDEMLLYLKQREEQQKWKDREREHLRLELADPRTRHALLQKSGMKIKVKNITNEVVSESGKTTIGLADRTLGPFLVLPSENIYDLKFRIYDEMGLAPKHQILLFNALELPDEWVIGRDAKLEDGSTVLLRHVKEASLGCTINGQCCVS